MKKIITMFLIFVLSISISACSSKISNTTKLEKQPLPSTTNVENTISNIIDNKLDIICNNPAAQLSSNPYDYTKDSQDYRDIVNLGENALKYMLIKFENSKENGLREYVMAIACSEILKENAENKNWATGRGWYDNYTKATK